MKVLVHDYPGYAFPVQLSRQLAKQGHKVKHLYAGYNNTPRGALSRKLEDPQNLSIHPIYIQEPLDKYNFVKRWRQEREYGELLAGNILDFSADVLISANTPLDAQRAAQRAARKTGTSFVFWIQDVIGVASHKILRKRLPIVGALIGRYYMAVEKNLLQNSDHVIAITDDFLSLLREWQVAEEGISVIPNWSTLDDLPTSPKSNPWAVRHGLDDKFCFMYTGTIGLKHNPEALLQLAMRYRENENVRVVVISDGPGANWLAEQKKHQDLLNLMLFPYQPYEQLPDVMGAADVLIALLEPDAGVFSVPSKVLSYFCAQRPVLAAISDENLAARLIVEQDAGLVVPPNDVEAFLIAAQSLVQNPEMRAAHGHHARAYAERHFDIQKIGDQFENILKAQLD